MGCIYIPVGVIGAYACSVQLVLCIQRSIIIDPPPPFVGRNNPGLSAEIGPSHEVMKQFTCDQVRLQMALEAIISPPRLRSIVSDICRFCFYRTLNFVVTHDAAIYCKRVIKTQITINI